MHKKNIFILSFFVVRLCFFIYFTLMALVAAAISSCRAETVILLRSMGTRTTVAFVGGGGRNILGTDVGTEGSGSWNVQR